jgi:uncharacterized protein
MLQIDLRELARGPCATVGELPADDPLFAGLGLALARPVVVGGKLQEIGEGRFYWHGSLDTEVRGECRRCLTAVRLAVAVDIGALFSQDPETEDDPDTYPLPRDAMLVDVTPAVREELVLAAPSFLLCRDDCRGLCPRCGKDLNAGPCGCAPATDSRWQQLAAHKDRFRE